MPSFSRPSQLVALAVLASSALPGCEAAPDPGPPSVVLVCLDTLRRDRLGAYGNADGLTPNLDRFAREAVLFEDAWAVGNETLLSHASLFTSRYPTETGPIFDGYALGPDEPTMAEVMGLHGYQTAAAVAGGHLGREFGLGRGFDHYVQGGSWASLFHTVPLATNWLDERDTAAPFLLFVHGYDTHHRYLKPGPQGAAFTDRDYLGPGMDAARQKLGTNRVLDGWLYPPSDGQPMDFGALRIRGQDERRRLQAFARDPAVGAVPMGARDLDYIVDVYDGAVAYADAWFGLLMAELEARELLDEVVIVVLSDHGEELGEHGMFGHRYTLTDESLAVPLMVRLPGGEGGGQRLAGTVDLTDVMPTLLEAAEATPPAGIRGRSLWPALHGEPLEPRGAVYAQTMFRAVSVRTPEGRLTFTGVGADSPWLGELMGTARLQAPAWEASEGLARAQQMELVASLIAWNAELARPSGSGAGRVLSPEQRQLMQDQGYWRPR